MKSVIHSINIEINFGPEENKIKDFLEKIQSFGQIYKKDLNSNINLINDININNMDYGMPIIGQARIQPIVNEEIQPVVHKEIQPVIHKEIQPVIHKEIQPVVLNEIQPVVHKEIQPVFSKEIQPVVRKEIQPVVRKEIQPVISQDIQNIKVTPMIYREIHKVEKNNV